MNQLHFHFEREDEWHGKLFATVVASRFAGEGGAWFNTAKLRDFAERVSAFPLRLDALPSIAGGFWAEGALEQVHLAVSLEPHNARGEVRITAQLATEVWNGEAEDLVRSATVRFLVTYADLGRFGPAFLDMLEGRSDKATLHSSAD